MIKITLTEEQLMQFGNGKEPVQFCDPEGYAVGFFQPLGITKEDIEEAKKIRANNTEWYTTEEVLEHLSNLEDQ